MTKPPRKYEKPLNVDAPFEEALERYANTDPKELDMQSREINKLPANRPRQELDPKQGSLDLRVEKHAEVDGIGMGVLADGTAFLTGRGLARLVDIENLHIRTISQEWNDDPPKPRIAGIKEILSKRGLIAPSAHIETTDGVRTIHAYPSEICLAILEFYAFDAPKPREAARNNYRILAGKALQDLIYSQVGYDPTGRRSEPLRKWHERIALNHQSAPKGYFSIFNEAHTIIYELIMAGAQVGEKLVPDISIGSCWAEHWKANKLGDKYGDRNKFPHRYPDDHPQSKSNPQTANCYPLEALGEYRRWLQEEYLEGGKFAGYLASKKQLIPPSVAQLAIERLAPASIEPPRRQIE
ncbi:MAG: hypothetical protein ACT4OU_05645 [Hyphomicrobium sp.]